MTTLTAGSLVTTMIYMFDVKRSIYAAKLLFLIWVGFGGEKTQGNFYLYYTIKLTN